MTSKLESPAREFDRRILNIFTSFVRLTFVITIFLDVLRPFIIETFIKNRKMLQTLQN